MKSRGIKAFILHGDATTTTGQVERASIKKRARPEPCAPGREGLLLTPRVGEGYPWP